MDKMHGEAMNLLRRVAETGHQTQKETVVETVLRLGFSPRDTVEYRLTSQGDILETMQRAVNVFLRVHHLYPTSVAVHHTIAAYVEASEFVLRAQGPEDALQRAVFLGKDFVSTPIRVEIDDSLDTTMVAVRWRIDIDDYREEMIAVLMRGLRGAQ